MTPRYRRGLDRPKQSIREGVWVSLGLLTVVVILVAGISIAVHVGWIR